MKKIIILFLVLPLFSCGPSAPKCTYGTPTAIFDSNVKGVLEHQFSASGQEAQEVLRFSEGFDLEILQGGCNSLRQEFRFSLPGKAPEDVSHFWIGQSIQLFHFLGNLGDQYLVYHQYANAIENAASQIQLGVFFSLGDGFSVKVDRIPGGDYNLLVVEIAKGKE